MSSKTCTTCHSDDGYSESVHGKAVLDGNPDSATCSDCHGLHKVPLLKGDDRKMVAFRKEFHTEVCQKCHADKEMMERNKVFLIATQTYYQSYHGKVEQLGYPNLVAGCADCHGFHSILPPDNPKSLISNERLLETCGKCHSGANANFVQWVAHATHNDPKRDPVFYWTFVIMTALLVWVFGVFWFHTLLWWRKDFWERRELRAKGIFFPQHVKPDEAGHIYRRFSSFDIVLHLTMMVDLYRSRPDRPSPEILSGPLGERFDAFSWGGEDSGFDSPDLCGYHLRLFWNDLHLHLLFSLLQERSREIPIPSRGSSVRILSALAGRIFRTSLE